MNMSTRKEVKRELRRLSEQREYIVKLTNTDAIDIEAIWRSDRTIDIDVCYIDISLKRKRGIFTMEQVKKDLAQFKSDIDHLCDACNILAKKAGKNKDDYFCELLLD